MGKVTSRSASTIFFVTGLFLIAGGSIVGTLTNHLGFPWGAVIAISAGVWSFFEGVKVYMKELSKKMDKFWKLEWLKEEQT